MPHTFTDDPTLLQYVADYRAAVAAAKPVSDAVWELTPGTAEWYEKRQESDRLNEALRTIETRLCAAFVWALEHGEK